MSLHHQVLDGNNQKRMVSPGWRRKCCLRNLECFCGRALSNWRNKSLATHPTPGVHSWRRRAEIVPAPLLARESTGTASSVGLPEVFTVPCSSCPPAGATEGAARGSHSVMFGLWEGNLQFHGRMAQSSSLKRWEERKVAALTDIPKYEVLGWELYRPNRWSWIVTALCVVVGRVKEPENGHKGNLQWTCANDNYIEVRRSVINVQETALAVLLLMQLQNLLKEDKMVQLTINQIVINFLLVR